MNLTFGDDGSEACDRVWSWIVSHPWAGWDIDVVYADTDPTKMQWGEAPERRAGEPQGDRPTADLVANQVEFTEASADPRVLLAAVTTDLLVVGMKTRGSLHSTLVGGTAEWLLNHPPSPLALIRRTEFSERVLVCADGSVHAERAARSLQSLPWVGECKITVLAVDDGRTDPDAAERMAQDLTGTSSSVDHQVRTGPATETVLQAVSDLSADLVVMGTRGLTGWKRLRLGSTASAVVRSSGCDNLVACVD